MIQCTETVAGGTISDLNLALGTTSSGEELITASSNKTLNDIDENSPSITTIASATTVYIQGNITGGNWDTMTAGQHKLYVTYIDNGSL